MLGSGAVIVIDDRCCMVQLGLRVAQFYMHESCGKCTPCREGVRWMVDILERIEQGRAEQGELDLLLSVCDRVLGKCLCPLGDAAAMPVASYVAKFRDEYQRHIDEGALPLRGGVVVRGPRRAGHPALPRRSAPDRHPGVRRLGRMTASARLYLGAGPVRPGRARMSSPELVTVTIDGRSVTVPRRAPGSSRRQPRSASRSRSSATSRGSGRPLGACRMCLVEVEGLPKLQAACTLTAQDGIVVQTAATSEQSAEGQNAVLEFILLNHPLDCPDCDKGGECPLQDLTFRYGPGSTRMAYSEADVRQADSDLAADRSRPGALHPLLPLHPLLGAGRRGRPARGARSAARTRTSPRSRTSPTAPTSPATSSSCARSARSPRPCTASARGRGRSRTCRRCAASARSAATPGRRRARARSRACSRATIRRSTRAGSATRADSPTTT